MKQILKTLGKFTLPIITIIFLLIGQAMCDLALPDYTSKIVNIGIQQNGIEDAVPEVIRAKEFDKILLVSKDNKKIKNSYHLISKENLSKSQYEEYQDKYPLLKSESLYVLKNNINREELSEIIINPLVIVQAIENDNGRMKAEISKKMGIEVTDIFALLEKTDEQIRFKFLKEGTKKYANIDSSLTSQMAIQYVKNEYEKIKIDVEQKQINYIINTGLKMLLLSLLSMTFTVGTVFLSARVGAGFSKKLRSKVVDKTMAFSNKEFDEIGSSSLITRCTNDITQIQMVITMILRIVIYAPIIGFGALSKVSNSSMSWVIGVAVLALLSLVIILFTFALPKFKKVQELIDRLNLVSRETLNGLPVIRAFSNEKFEEKRFDKANTDLTKVNLFIGRILTIMMPSMMFIMNGISVLIVWVGADKVDMGTMQVGTLMAFIAYTMQIIMSFLMLSMMSFILPRALVSSKRIAEVLDKEISVKNPKNVKQFEQDKKGIVEFKDVYFRYPDAEEDVLRNISFTATPGTTTAFIGSTGSGKSTLINLIPRFFDVTGGKILIDGVNIKDVKIQDLRSKIGYVPQKGILFSGTIETNIAFGNDTLTKAKIEKAAKISQSLEFINDKDNKFAEEISQGGTNVSGGQKQRLAIARAIAINPEIYIFDDSFSALDYKTDKTLRKELSKEIKDGTILIVAQRIGTVINADQIVVLDQGKIVGIGTHKQLLKDCEVYKEIALSQLSKEELENA